MTNQKRNIRAPWHADVRYAGMTMDEWDEHDRIITTIRNYLKKSISDTHQIIYEKGKTVLLAEIANADLGQLSDDAKIAIKRKELQEARQREENLIALYRDGGAAMLEWAKSENISGVDDIDIDNYFEIEPWNVSASNWLAELFATRSSIKTAEVFRLAIENGIIADSTKDRNRLMQLARRNNYISGEYGVWRLPEKHKTQNI